MAESPERTQSRRSSSVNYLSHMLMNPSSPSFPPRLIAPLLFSDSTPHSSTESINGVSSKPGSGFSGTFRISGPYSAGKGGPAFIGHVFSMCDLSGTGLMAVSTHFDIPFLSKRTPEWLKKMFSAVMKSERNGPVFRFFMDLGDAVSHVKRLNIPSGVVGACRLDLAFEHFKEKPHLFQFVPNEKQVKEANKLLNKMPQNGQKKHVSGVPVFSAQNLDIAIATEDGIKWYTPYFFDKSMLDNILENSVDQHFHSLIHTRRVQRRRGVDAGDDNIGAEVLEEMGDSIRDYPEILEALDEMSLPDIPFSVILESAEAHLLDAVDSVVLGNRWLRKAIGIQPKFPYMVDSFERRSIASLQRACKSSGMDTISNSDTRLKCIGSSGDKTDSERDKQSVDLRFPFSDWLSLPWLNRHQRQNSIADKKEVKRNEQYPSPFLPKVTMVGISRSEGGQVNKGSMKKTMEDLRNELEQHDHRTIAGDSNDTLSSEERDPLFVANVADYHRIGAKAGSTRRFQSGGTI